MNLNHNISLEGLSNSGIFVCFRELSPTFRLLGLNLRLLLLLSHIELLVKHLCGVWYPKDPHDVRLNSIDDFLVSA